MVVLLNTMPFDFNDVFMAKWHSCTTADEMYDLLSTIGPYEKVIDEVAEMYATSKAEIGSKSRPLKALVRERKRQLLHYTYNAERKVQQVPQTVFAIVTITSLQYLKRDQKHHSCIL